MDYLPEWKIYLWEKLLLDKRSSNDTRKISDFIFFDDEDQYAIPLRLAQNEINRIEAIKRGNGTFTDIGESTAIEDSYYNFEPKKILSALLELANGEVKIVEILNITISPLYLIQYHKKRGEYLAQQRKLRVASISSGGSGRSEPNQHYFNDTHCGLGDAFSKVRDSQELSMDELKKMMYCPVDFLLDYLSLKIKIDKISLAKKLHEYINHFMLGELIPPPKVRYFSSEQQQEKIVSAIELSAKKYGHKNISVTFHELAEVGGWYYEQSHFRFYETMFSLEIAGKIKIQDLRKEEVVISLADTSEIEKIISKENIADLEKSLEKKMVIIKNNSHNSDLFKVVMDYHAYISDSDTISKIIRQLIDREKITPRYLQEIFNDNALSGIFGYSKKPLPVNLYPKFYSAELEEKFHLQRKFFELTGKDYDDFKKNPKPIFIDPNMRTVRVDRNNILVDMQMTHNNIMEGLVSFSAKKSETSSPLASVPVVLPEQTLSAANKKKLCILEKLKDRWDLVSKKGNNRSMVHGALIYLNPGGQDDIPQHTFNSWIDEGGVDDYRQFQNILAGLQDEGLITSFEFLSEYR